MKAPRVTRTFALIAVPVTAAVGIAVGVVALGPSAQATSTGFTYQVGVFTGTQTIDLAHLTNLVVQNDPQAVAGSMTADELSAATTALGGVPAVGVTITKTFDQSDKALSMQSLNETALPNAGVFTYYNGALCDHIRGNPMYVASIDQTGPQAGSSSAITETIEFAATAFVQVVPNTCPIQTLNVTTGISYFGEIDTSGGAVPMSAILSVAIHPGVVAQAHLSSHEGVVFKNNFGGSPGGEIAIKKQLDATDLQLKLDKDTGQVVPGTLVITEFKNNAPIATFTLTHSLLVSLDVDDVINDLPISEAVFAYTTLSAKYD